MWETVVGLKALLRLAADATDEVRDPAIDLERRLDVVRRRAAAGDARTLGAIDEVGGWLVSGCGNLVNVFNPEVLVLGGYFAVLGEWLLPQLREGLREHVFAPEAGGVAIEFSTLGFSAAIRGGALRAAEAVFDDPTLAPVRLPSEVLGEIRSTPHTHRPPHHGSRQMSTVAPPADQPAAPEHGSGPAAADARDRQGVPGRARPRRRRPRRPRR